MKLSHQSDTQLVYHTLKGLFLTETDSSQAVFAFELSGSNLKALMAFDARTPLRGFGVPALTSFFVHASPNHLFANLPWLILAGSALQKRHSNRTLIFILAVGHLAALIGATAAHRWAGEPPLVVGMSGGAVSLLLCWLFGRFKYVAWAALLAVGAALLVSNVGLFLSHAPALLMGVLLGMFFSRHQQKNMNTHSQLKS
jgi:membrane associated rhomboid family serine protease